jgi:hypothetical protein
MEIEFIMKFGIRFNCKGSIIVEGRVGNVKRRVGDCFKD